MLIETRNKKYKNKKFETIYIGDGTRNCLSDLQLIKVLRALSQHLAKKYEFTIEVNLEFITNNQAKIFQRLK